MIQRRQDRSSPQPRDLSPVAKFVSTNEGVRNSVYTDSRGHPTVGIGFNLDRSGARKAIEAVGADYQAVRNGEEELTDEQVQQLFQVDLEKARTEASNIVSTFSSLSPNRQMAITDMIFNMGPKRFREFKKMRQALEQGDFETAATEAQNSLWFNQVGRRAQTVVSLIRNG